MFLWRLGSYKFHCSKVVMAVFLRKGEIMLNLGVFYLSLLNRLNDVKQRLKL